MPVEDSLPVVAPIAGERPVEAAFPPGRPRRPAESSKPPPGVPAVETMLARRDGTRRVRALFGSGGLPALTGKKNRPVANDGNGTVLGGDWILCLRPSPMAPAYWRTR